MSQPGQSAAHPPGSGGPERDPEAAADPEDVDHRARAAEKRRLAEIFGDVLPEQTRDDAADPSELGDTDRTDEWLRRQVPPHHG